MFSFLKRRRPDADSIVAERWGTCFHWYEQKRFPEEDTASYSASIRGGGLTLAVKKPDCLAWITSRLYRYRDFVLEGNLRFDPGNGYSAAGFLLRYINDENFYLLLVSNHGYLRFDAVFNLKPLHLIGWTELPSREGEELSLKVIANGSHFSFYSDDEWVAEVEDETLPSGTFGVAAQNFGEKDRASFSWERIDIDSRPLEVEKAYLRWARFIPALHEQRIRLARTFFAMERYSEAVIQLNKALAMKTGSAEEYLLRGEAYLKLKLFDRALESVEKCLELEPARIEALQEKANLLYLAKDFLKARDYLRSILPLLEDNPRLWNLLGNCEYSLGNWDKALAAYREAAALEPETALYWTNAARVEERLSRPQEALKAYATAARLLFKEESYDELTLILPRAKELAVNGRGELQELQAIEGKMLFHEGRLEAAAGLFGSLIAEDSQDSAVYYLYGLILGRQGRRAEARRFLEKAANLEPGYHLYWMRLAENLFLQGLDPLEALSKARELAAEDPWVNNLSGQVLMAQGRFEEAWSCFQAALQAAPAEADLYLNASELLARQKRYGEAVALISAGLDTCGEKAALYNRRGNLKVAAGGRGSALQDYEQALRLEPESAEYAENAASACIELDRILRAEELLGRLLETSPTASVYNLTGNLAALKGEYARAELSYRQALSLEPGNSEVSLNLASLYLATGDVAKARALAEEVLGREPRAARALGLLQRLSRPQA